MYFHYGINHHLIAAYAVYLYAQTILSGLASPVNERSLINNLPYVTDSAVFDSLSDGESTKMSCGFDLSHAPSLKTFLVKGENTSLFIQEDSSQIALAIPLVLSVEVS